MALAAATLAAAPAWAQDAPTTEESPLFTVTVPAAAPVPPTPPEPPTPVAPSSSSVASSSADTSAAPAPVLPGQLAATGADPWLIIAGGLGLMALSLVARSRLRARGEGA